MTGATSKEAEGAAKDAEIARLREALEQIAFMDVKCKRADDLGRAATIARAALTQHKENADQSAALAQPQPDCRACNGSGERRMYDMTQGPHGEHHLVSCPDCNGTGNAPQPDKEIATLSLDATDVSFLAARLRRLFAHFDYPLPGFAKDDARLIAIAGSAIGAVLAQPADAQAVAREEVLWDKTLRDRDNNHDWADKLADAIGEHLGIDIGEHTAGFEANNPWANALDAIAAAPKPAPASAQEWLTNAIALLDGIRKDVRGSKFGGLQCDELERVLRSSVASAPPGLIEFLVDVAAGVEERRPERHTEQVAQLRQWVSALKLAPQAVAAGAPTIPDDEETRFILGFMCFQCITIARAFREAGEAIPTKAEAEQAFVIRKMLNHYLQHGAEWRKAFVAELETVRPEGPREAAPGAQT